MMQSFTKSHSSSGQSTSPSPKQAHFISMDELMELMSDEFGLFINSCFITDQTLRRISPEQVAHFTAYLKSLSKFQQHDPQELYFATKLLCVQNAIEVSDVPPFASLE